LPGERGLAASAGADDQTDVPFPLVQRQLDLPDQLAALAGRDVKQPLQLQHPWRTNHGALANDSGFERFDGTSPFAVTARCQLSRARHWKPSSVSRESNCVCCSSLSHSTRTWYCATSWSVWSPTASC